MKTTDPFKATIEEHLKMRAFRDPMFAKLLKKDHKNLDDCITYILNTVKASECEGFEDDEIFNMAFHYYSEDDLKVSGSSNHGQVVVNHRVKLTAEEREEAKKKAYNQVIEEEKARLRKKPKKPTPIDNKGKTDNEVKTLF
jgi:hypothetical protein